MLRQREYYKKGKLSENRLERLKAVGFTVECRSKSWESNCAEAQAYYEAHGDLEVPPEYVAPNGTWLGKWVSEHRVAYQRGTLQTEKEARLDAIGMRWENTNMPRWCDNLEVVTSYPRTLNGVPEDAVSECGTKLTRRAERQYRRYGQKPDEA